MTSRTKKRQQQNQPLTVGDRVRAKTTGRAGEITHVHGDGTHDHVTVAYDGQPQDDYLTTPAREGADFPRELVDRET